MIWPFTRRTMGSTVLTSSDAACVLAQQGHAQRRAKIIATMNTLRAEAGLPRFEGRAGQ